MSESDRGDGREGARPDRESPDLRWAPLVGGVWLGEVLVLTGQPARPMVWAGCAGVALLVGLCVTSLRASWQQPDRRRLLLHVGALLLGGASLGVAVSSLHVARLHPPALADAAAEGVVMTVEATLTSDPRVSRPTEVVGRQIPPTWSVAARVSRATVRGREYKVRLPVQLRGDDVRELEYGERVRLTGRATQTWAPHSYSFTVRVAGPGEAIAGPGWPARVTTRIREAFRAACAGLPPDAGALLLGLAVGDESTVSAPLDEAMVRAGLAHLTAVSGSNTSLVVGIAMAAVVGLGAGWRVRVVVCLAVLGGYVLLVRPEPSVLRAAGMGVVALIALSAGGRRRGPPALLSAALVLLLALPQLALSVGFALSFCATAGLLVVGPPLSDRLAVWPGIARVPEPVRAALAVAAAAHLATLPLAVMMGNGVSLVALPANVVVTPLVPIATVVGLAAALVAPVAPVIAELLATVASPATWLIAQVAHRSAGAPGGVLDVPPAPAGVAGAAVAVAVLVLVIVRDRRGRGHPRRIIAAALVATLLVGGWHRRPSGWPPSGWVVLACDVGQGDALLVRRPGSPQALLVDTGPDPEATVACLGEAQVDELVVLITHFHADHINGLAAVLARWPVAAVLTGPIQEPEPAATAVARLADAAGVETGRVRAGSEVSAAGLGVGIIWPERRMAVATANNSSVVALVGVPTPAGDITVLLTGDIEPEAQAVLMAGTPPAATVVKVPHHGSAHQHPDFATWSGARIALVSASADNDYGHPGPETIEQYRARGALVGRTDQDGDLAVVPTPSGVALVVRR